MTSQEHMAKAIDVMDKIENTPAESIPSLEVRSVAVQVAQVHALIGIGQSLQEIRVALGQMKPIRI